MAEIKFTPNKELAEQSGGFKPLPDGQYEAMIIGSDYKETNAGTGHYLSLQFSIISGDKANRVIFENYNLDNPNQKAVKIANQQLSQLCFACGKGTTVNDSEELHNIPIMIDVVASKDGRGNSIKKYSLATSQPKPTPKPNPKTETPPWAK